MGGLFKIDIFFLSGEVFKDQASLLMFISAGLCSSGLLEVVIVEQFIHVCVWLCVCVQPDTKSHSFHLY